MCRSSVHILQGVCITANTFDLYIYIYNYIYSYIYIDIISIYYLYIMFIYSFAGAQHPQLDDQSKQVALSLSWH